MKKKNENMKTYLISFKTTALQCDSPLQTGHERANTKASPKPIERPVSIVVFPSPVASSLPPTQPWGTAFTKRHTSYFTINRHKCHLKSIYYPPIFIGRAKIASHKPSIAWLYSAMGLCVWVQVRESLTPCPVIHRLETSSQWKQNGKIGKRKWTKQKKNRMLILVTEHLL